MSSRAHSRIALVLALLLVAMHLDFWRPQRPLLVFGWLPEELLWRLGWMGAALLFLCYFCAFVWREEG